MENIVKRNKILVVSAGYSFFTEPHVKALTELGYNCLVFNYRSGIVYTNPYMRKALRVFPWIKVAKRFTIARTNKRLLELVKEFKPEYLFSLKAENITPETINKIRSMGIITMNFYNDFINQWEGIVRIAPAYDYFFSPDHYVLKKLWGMGLKNSFYLPHAVETLFESSPFDKRENKYNISFIGSYNKILYPNREKFLLAIKDLGLHVWGTDEWYETPLKDVFHGQSKGLERFDIYRKSKIVVDINWNNLPAEGINVRPFEVGYSGACLFSDLVRADIKRVFNEGKEFVSFNNENELRQKIQYYLSHDSERETIARACYEKIIKKHTYQARMREMFNIVNSVL
ncbi:MAG: glycosyltransferase [Patescibacteria group bacterium]